MSILSTPAPVWQWPADVHDFGVRNQIESFLDPLLAATHQVFSTLRNLRVFLQLDPEIPNDWHIVFEVQVPCSDIPDYVQAQHAWTNELFRICPSPLVCIFCLALVPVDV